MTYDEFQSKAKVLKSELDTVCKLHTETNSELKRLSEIDSTSFSKQERTNLQRQIGTLRSTSISCVYRLGGIKKDIKELSESFINYVFYS